MKSYLVSRVVSSARAWHNGGLMRWLLLALVVGCSGGNGRTGPTAAQSGDVTLFLTAELLGTLEPCGCTSDPMGYLDRTAALIDEAHKERPTALFDGGSTLWPKPPIDQARRPQEKLEADLVASLLPRLRLAAAGLGPTDLEEGVAAVRPARQAANVTGAHVEAPKIVDLGGVRVGVFGVVDPALVKGAGAAEDAARGAIRSLREKGAQVVVALAHMPRAKARKLAREAPGADIVLVGADVPELGAPLEQVGGSFLVTPGSKGQVVARLDVHVDAGGGALVDAIGPERAESEIARLSERIARIEADLAKWEKDPAADPAFMKTSREERDRLARERAALEASPLRKPDKGSWFTLRMIPVKKRLPCAADVLAAKKDLDRKIGETNLALSRDEKAPPVPDGKAGYVGTEECVYCHKEAVEFWRGTRHAQAWETLESANKHLNRDCVSCHVTGWMEPGGATLVANEPLRDVQCEVCHGPGSLHVEADGKEKPGSMVLAPERDLCATKCHTPEHSDTFEWEAYMRDVTGKGHGEKLRASLGDGATGRQLRGAALEKAGREIGAGCAALP